MTLEEAQAWLRERVDDGATCPCCRQFAKVYRRSIHSSMAAMLCKCYRRHKQEWFYLPDEGSERQTTDAAKMRYWGLMTPMEGKREDGSKRIGWWKLTERGVRFARREIVIPKYVRIYAGRCLGPTGDPVTIVDCLGDRFSYEALMAA